MIIQRGFTLVEVLVAMAITAFIGTVAYVSFDTAMEGGEQNQQKLRQLNTLDRAMNLLERDLQQAIRRSVVVNLGEQQSAFEGIPQADLSGFDVYLMRFSRAGWHNPQQQLRSELQRVGYRLADEQLWRDHWPHLDMTDEVPPVQLPLLQGVKQIRLRYLRPQAPLSWVQEWPVGLASGNSANGASEALPLAVEITLELEEWGEITRLFMLPAA
ncbi:type II secretion system minor pseudopilin GspJ [Porticoccus sp. W117]|uniref:type II secretion system minor pseudopilin GspJ n=1 Tax=Porticoccus sp. W117 TaxID=3054777 RepID=UPI002592E197|nr:type II secretion system minor pseudopilin GspJ [Porticoccus sp. W117]MDM3869758.1 type II secretion system minor pseudopilin GspJ [Porticoccus sp. W117]